MAKRNPTGDIGEAYNSAFAKRLRDIMSDGIGSQGGYTQEEIAKIMGVKRQAISQYCNGVTVPTIDKLEKLADYFEVTTDYLLGRTDIKTLDFNVREISEQTGLKEDFVKDLIDSNLGNSNYVYSSLNAPYDLIEKLDAVYPGLGLKDENGNFMGLGDIKLYFSKLGLSDKEFRKFFYEFHDLWGYAQTREDLEKSEKILKGSGFKLADFVNTLFPDVYAFESFVKLHKVFKEITDPSKKRDEIEWMGVSIDQFHVAELLISEITEFISSRLGFIKNRYIDEFELYGMEAGDPDGMDKEKE